MADEDDPIDEIEKVKQKKKDDELVEKSEKEKEKGKHGPPLSEAIQGRPAWAMVAGKAHNQNDDRVTVSEDLTGDLNPVLPFWTFTGGLMVHAFTDAESALAHGEVMQQRIAAGEWADWLPPLPGES